MRKIGFIFECGRQGPDEKVCRHSVNMINTEIEFIPKTLDNKKNLIANCGLTTKILLKSCEKVIIIWDLFPAWRENKGKPCLHQDRINIFSELKANGVSEDKVELVCIQEELEAWLIADERALKEFIQEQIHPHPVGKVKKSSKPDRVRNPKTLLTKIFNQEIGNSRKYIDYQDAERIIKKLQNLKRLDKSESFKRFKDKLK